MIGPSMTPIPQIAIADPRSSAEYESSSTDCESGTSAAPNAPCSRRNVTICSMFWASPHSTEANVKPAAQTTNSFLRPNRSAIHPIGAVMMADATMYDVSTQLI